MGESFLNDKSKVCFFSGPRPKNLPSESYEPYQTANKRMLLALRDLIIDHIENKGIEVFITGMALGIDLWASRIVLKLKEQDKYSHVKLVGAIPIPNQSKIWKREGKEEWELVFNQLDEYHEVFKLEDYKLSSRLEMIEHDVLDEEGNVVGTEEIETRVQPTVSEKMQRRNEFMVDNSSRGIVVFTGKPGGTMNCAIYAADKGMGNNVVLLSPTSLKVQEGII